VNVGRRPTFGAGALSVEAHLLGFDGDVYGRRLRLEFEARIRSERRFETTAALRRQIDGDIAEAGRLLEAG
jgi:riboflavin kinase/FMN adenylyltransferase